jgi:hypothetical protein
MKKEEEAEERGAVEEEYSLKDTSKYILLSDFLCLHGNQARVRKPLSATNILPNSAEQSFHCTSNVSWSGGSLYSVQHYEANRVYNITFSVMQICMSDGHTHLVHPCHVRTCDPMETDCVQY